MKPANTKPPMLPNFFLLDFFENRRFRDDVSPVRLKENEKSYDVEMAAPGFGKNDFKANKNYRVLDHRSSTDACDIFVQQGAIVSRHKAGCAAGKHLHTSLDQHRGCDNSENRSCVASRNFTVVSSGGVAGFG